MITVDMRRVTKSDTHLPPDLLIQYLERYAEPGEWRMIEQEVWATPAALLAAEVGFAQELEMDEMAAEW